MHCGALVARTARLCGVCGREAHPAPPTSAASALPAKQSSWVAVAIVFVLVAVILGVAYAAFRPSGLTGFRVTAADCWSGVFASGSASQTLDGCASIDIPMGCSGAYSVYMTKDSTGTWTLLVERLRNGEVIANQSTSAPNGVLSLAGTC
jgi:hypothetical protein